MNERFSCPVCDSNSWERLAEWRYYRRDIPSLTSKLKAKYRLLFGIWFSGQDVACITSIMCASCGFVTFSPRPSEAEIDKKYRSGGSCGEPRPPTRFDLEVNRQRAAGLYHDLTPYLKARSEILDYGGNDGQLVMPFLKDGHQCYLVDYSRNCVHGVVRLGSVIAEVDRDRIFDAIVLSHVLEHVSDPLQLLSALKAHHSKAGVIYVEVPMELWGRIPPGKDPVTHINYFAPPVLERLLRRSGYNPVYCKLNWHYTARWSLVVRAIAICPETEPSESPVYPISAEYSRSMMRCSIRAFMRIVRIDWKRAPWFFGRVLLRRAYRILKRVLQAACGPLYSERGII